MPDKLNYYLRPEGELLSDPEYFRINTELTAYTAFFALAEIGNYDPLGKMSGSHMPDGVLQVRVEDGIGVYLEVKGGRLNCIKGHHDDPESNS